MDSENKYFSNDQISLILFKNTNKFMNFIDGLTLDYRIANLLM